MPTTVVRQCAWCYRVLDLVTGLYSAFPLRKIRSATHGICPACRDEMRAQIDASLPLAA